MIEDTSEFISSDQGFSSVVGDTDPYQKIKLHSNLVLRNLLKNNAKVLMNYWYIIFPSFMMRTQSEFSQYLYTYEDNTKQEKDFTSKVFEVIETQEPTLLYVIRQPNNMSHLKSQMYATL